MVDIPFVSQIYQAGQSVGTFIFQAGRSVVAQPTQQEQYIGTQQQTVGRVDAGAPIPPVPVGGAPIPPQQAPTQAPPPAQAGTIAPVSSGRYVVAVGPAAVQAATLPKTVQITEPPLFTIPFTGISLGGGTKTISTQEYLQKYQPVGAGTLLSPGPGGIQLKSQYTSPLEQGTRWVGGTEQILTRQMEETGTPFYGLRAYGVPVPSFGRIEQLQSGYWQAVYEKAETTLPSGPRQIVQVGAGTIEYVRTHPLTTAASLVTAEALHQVIPAVSSYAAAAPAGSITARIAPYAGGLMTWGTRAIVGVWGIGAAGQIAASKTPYWTAGQVSGEALPWVTPYFVRTAPAFYPETIDWLTGRVPEVSAWRALSAQELKPKSPIQELDLRPEIDVTNIQPEKVRITGGLPMANIEEIEAVTGAQETRLLVNIAQRSGFGKVIGGTYYSGAERAAIEAAMGEFPMATIAEMPATFSVPVEEVPIITPAQKAVSMAQLSYPYVLAGGAARIGQTAWIETMPRVDTFFAQPQAPREDVMVLPWQAAMPATAQVAREEVMVLPRVDFAPSQVQIPREDVTIVPRFEFPPSTVQIPREDVTIIPWPYIPSPTVAIPTVDVPLTPWTPPPPMPTPPATPTGFPGFGWPPSGGGGDLFRMRQRKAFVEIFPIGLDISTFGRVTARMKPKSYKPRKFPKKTRRKK